MNASTGPRINAISTVGRAYLHYNGCRLKTAILTVNIALSIYVCNGDHSVFVSTAGLCCHN